MVAPPVRPNHTQNEALVAEWVYTQNDPAEELAQLHYFSIKKVQPEGGVEFVITVKEFASRNSVQMRFYAQADKEVNQRNRPVPAFWLGRFAAGRTHRMRPRHTPISLRAG